MHLTHKTYVHIRLESKRPSGKHFQAEANFHNLPHVLLAALNYTQWLPFQYGNNISPWHLDDPVFLRVSRIKRWKENWSLHQHCGVGWHSTGHSKHRHSPTLWQMTQAVNVMASLCPLLVNLQSSARNFIPCSQLYILKASSRETQKRVLSLKKTALTTKQKPAVCF